MTTVRHIKNERFVNFLKKIDKTVDKKYKRRIMKLETYQNGK